MAVWMLSAVMAFGQPGEEKVFEVHPLDFSDVFATEQAVETLVGDEGNVILDAPNHRLLVYTTPLLHKRIAALLEKVSLPSKNVRIDVVFAQAGTERDSRAAIHGQGDVIIHPDGVDGRIVLQPELKHEVTETSGHTTQSLLIASGREGHLLVGEQIPYQEWLIDYGRRWGYVEGHLAWQNVGAKLVVQPTVLSDGKHIRVRLTPELSGLVDGQPYHTQFAKVATEVVVADGESFRIGGLAKDNEFYSRFLVGGARGNSQQNMDITLTPRVVLPSAAPAP